MRKAQTTRGNGTVKIVRLNQPTVEINLDGEMTVRDVLEAVNVDTSLEVWCNGERAALEDIVEDGDILQVVGKYEGGC